MTRPVYLIAAGVHTDAARTLEAFLGGPAPEEPPATGAFLPARQRRRTSPLTRALADTFEAASDAEGVDRETVAIVVGSALGEAHTMLALLEQMATPEKPLSPMKFVTSVHNTASGMISIAAKNRGFTTSLGADFDTPAMALVEAIGWVASTGEAAVVCCGDEASPEDLVDEATGWGSVAAAVALSPTPTEGALSIAIEAVGEATLDAAPIDPRSARNPNAGLLDLIAAWSRGQAGVVALDRGRGRGYLARLAPRDA